LELQSPLLGLLRYDPREVVFFPDGIPAFEDQHRFILVPVAEKPPVILLQGVDCPELAFLTVPVESVVSGYELELTPEAKEALGRSPEAELAVGRELLCLAIVTAARQGPATANLLAPVVIDVETRRGIQFIQFDSGYSHQHPLGARIEED